MAIVISIWKFPCHGLSRVLLVLHLSPWRAFLRYADFLCFLSLSVTLHSAECLPVLLFVGGLMLFCLARSSIDCSYVSVCFWLENIRTINGPTDCELSCAYFSQLTAVWIFFFLPVVVVETGHEVSTSDASVEFSEHMIIYWKTNSLLNMRKSIKMFPFRWLSHYIVYTSHCVC